MKKNNRAIFSTLLISLFLLSLASTVNAQHSYVVDELTKPKAPATIKLEINLDPLVKELGYTDAEIDEMSEDPYFAVRLIHEYCTVPLAKDKDGVYRSIPVAADFKPLPTDALARNEPTVQKEGGDATLDWLIDDKVCVFISVLDYPGTTHDLTAAADEIDDCYDNLESGDYYEFYAVQEGDATQVNVWEWVTWACLVYTSVDVFIYGHGAEIDYNLNGVQTHMAGYVTYNSFDTSNNFIPGNCLLAIDWSSFSDFGDGYNPPVDVDYSAFHFGMFEMCEAYGDANCIGFEYYWTEDSAYEPSRDSCFVGSPGLNLVADQAFWTHLTERWVDGYSSSQCYTYAQTFYAYQATYPIDIHDYSDPIWL